MSKLRFKKEINNLKNALFTTIPIENDVNTSLSEGETISLAFQFSHIEPAPFVYENDLYEAIWIAEIFPSGKFIEEWAMMFSEVIRLEDNTTYQLGFPVDQNNILVAHITTDDGDAFPFEESETVALTLRATDLQPEPGGLQIRNIPTQVARLVPMGKIVDDYIISEAQKIG